MRESNRNQLGRAGVGLITITHRGKPVTTSVGSARYESQYCGLTTSQQFSKRLGSVPLGYEHRPELISSLFLGSPVSWWKICERNSIFDVFEQMNPGDGIFIPGA